jgi:polyhydroxyalkanoate synthesis regulator phasin
MTTPTQHPVGDPPSFQCSPIDIDDSFDTRLPSSFSQNDNGDLDASLAAIDLEHITSTAVKGNVQMMLHTLFIQTIKKAIIEFNACITHREELNRIKLVTTQIPMESLAAKVTAKIHAERPADRPVLTGLIHDEAEKLISDLKRKLQSATDQMESNSKKLKELTSTREPRTSSPKQQRQAKNNNGGNLSWSRAQSTSSTAAAEDSSATHHQQVHQTTRTPKPQNQKGSHAANNNATAAQRRRRNKQRLNNKLRGKDNN